MSYRFVKITTFYPEFLQYYYRKNPSIILKNYEDQLAHLMLQAYGAANFFQIHLKELGVDALEIVANAEPLQKTWGCEHGIQKSGKDLVAEQLKAIKPDVILFQDSLLFNGDWVKNLRMELPLTKLILGSCCSPFSQFDIDNFRVFDHLLTCSPGFYNAFKKAGLPAYHLYHAFEHTLLPRINENNHFPAVDLIFTGSFVSKSGFHLERIKLFEDILKTGLRMKIHTKLHSENKFKLAAKRMAYYTARGLKKINFNYLVQEISILKTAGEWIEMPRGSEFSQDFNRAVCEPLYGLEMLKALSHAKMGFNIHLDSNPVTDFAANIRLFEVTGVGSCLITDWKPNIRELFEPNEEIVTYSSAEECTEKIRWLNEHPEVRAKIAKAGQTRCLRDHTYKKRAAQLNDFIVGALA